MLNRCALIVRPAKPYIDWANGVDDSGIEAPLDGECTVYLLPSFAYEHEAEVVLKLVFEEVFERELLAWHTVEDDWPKNRTWAMFNEWFVVEMHSMVEDLCADPLLDDE